MVNGIIDTGSIKLRITIPYKAIATENPDCLSCHTVNRGDTIWKAIKFADTALYVAKTTSRDKIVEYTKEMSENEATR